MVSLLEGREHFVVVKRLRFPLHSVGMEPVCFPQLRDRWRQTQSSRRSAGKGLSRNEGSTRRSGFATPPRRDCCSRTVAGPRRRSLSHAVKLHRVLGNCDAACGCHRVWLEQRTRCEGSRRFEGPVSLAARFTGDFQPVARSCETTACPRQARSRRVGGCRNAVDLSTAFWAGLGPKLAQVAWSHGTETSFRFWRSLSPRYKDANGIY